MKLSNVRLLGRYINPETGRPVNVHNGRWMTRGVDLLFFYRSGSRVFITDKDFSESWVKYEKWINDKN